MIEVSRLRQFFYVVFSLIVSTVIFLPSVRMKFGLVEIALLTAVYALCFFRTLLPSIKKMILPMIIYGLMCFLFGMPFQFKLGFLHPIMTLWIWVFPYLMCAYLIQQNNNRSTLIILCCLLMMFGVVFFATIKAMDIFPDVMRMMTSGDTDSNLVTRLNLMNVGGYGIAYGCGAIFLGTLSAMFAFRLNKRFIIFAIALIVPCLYIIVKAQFATLLILCFLWTMISILICMKSLFVKMIVCIVCILILLFADPILYTVVEFFQGTATGDHLQDVYNSFFLNEQYKSLRSEYQLNALSTWLQNPLFGNDLTIQSNADVASHSHSTLLSIGLKSGLMGMVCYYMCYYYAFKGLFDEILDIKVKHIFIILGGYFFCLSVFNPTESDILSFCLGMLSPLLVFTFYDNRQ